MPSHVEQHVPDRVPNFAWGLQHPHVVAIRQQPTTPPERAPQRPDHSEAQGLHPTTERILIFRLDDQVRVIPHERVVHQPELPALAPSRESLLERPDEGWSS